MKRFHYRYSLLEPGVDTNSDRTSLRAEYYPNSGAFHLRNSDWRKLNSRIEQATIPEVTYSDYSASVSYISVNSYTFYCDSISGCKDSTHQNYYDGDGTADNPYRSVNYALYRMLEIRDCRKTAQCCYNDPVQYLQLKIKGTVDYDVCDYWSNVCHSFDFEVCSDENEDEEICFPRLILTPWNGSKFTITTSWNINGIIIGKVELEPTGWINTYYSIVRDLTLPTPAAHVESSYFSYSIIVKMSCQSNAYSWDYNETPIYFSYSKILDVDCNNVTLYGGSYNTFYGGSLVITDTGIRTSGQNNITAFTFGRYCIVNNFSVTINNNTECDPSGTGDISIYRECIGFRDNDNGVFRNCSANIGGSGQLCCSNVGYGTLDYVGFYQNGNASFVNCSTTNLCLRCENDSASCLTPDF